jgi:hypothetical protein
MYPLPEQPEPRPARLRPLPGTQPETPVPLSAPLADLPLSPHLAADLLPASGRGPATAPATDPAVPATDPAAPDGDPAAPDGDRQRDRIRDEMAERAARATAASSWLQSSRHYSRLVNRDGIVPLTARMTAGDLAFLAEAREQVLQFTELTLRLIDLHQPLDAGGITTDPTSPIRRCRSCMWRWPCPTFSILAEVADRPPAG